MVHRNRSLNISLFRKSADSDKDALVRCRRYAKWYYNPEWKQIMGEAFAEIKRVELAADQVLRLAAWQPVLEELRTFNQRVERLAELAGEIFEALTRLVQCAESMTQQLLGFPTRHGCNSDESQGLSDRPVSAAPQARSRRSSSRS